MEICPHCGAEIPSDWSNHPHCCNEQRTPGDETSAPIVMHDQESALFHPTSDPDSASPSVLIKAVTGDSSAWATIDKLYRHLVYKWLRSWELNRENAEDVTQEVFKTAFSKIDQFRRNEAGQRFRKWLWSIAESRFLDFVRKHNPEKDGTQATGLQLRSIPDPISMVVDSEDQQRFDQSWLYRRSIELLNSEFSPEHVRAFMMVEVEHHTPNEAAKILGITTNALYIARTRIKKRLKEVLGNIIEVTEEADSSAPEDKGQLGSFLGRD